MSFGYKKPSDDNTAYDKDVSLDNFGLTEIIKTLEKAKECLKIFDFSGAQRDLNFAWALVPPTTRKQVINPTLFIKEKKKGIPVIEEILRHSDWLKTIDDFDFQSYSESEGAHLDASHVMAAVYRRNKIAEIIEEAIENLTVDTINAIDSAGLYIKTNRRRVIPTAELEPEKPLPTLNKLPASLPRG